MNYTAAKDFAPKSNGAGCGEKMYCAHIAPIVLFSFWQVRGEHTVEEPFVCSLEDVQPPNPPLITKTCMPTTSIPVLAIMA